MALNTSSKLLINESPLQVLPSLVSVVGGLEKAIILQQIQYCLTQKTSGIYLDDGEKYIWNTAEDFHANYFPFLKPDTIRKHLKALETKGFLVTQKPFAKQRNHTKYYRIDYAKLNEELKAKFPEQIAEESENVNDLDTARFSESNRKTSRIDSEFDAASDSEYLADSLKEQRILQRIQTKREKESLSAASDSEKGIPANEIFDEAQEIEFAEFENAVWEGIGERRVDTPSENPKWKVSIEWAFRKDFTSEQFLACIDDLLENPDFNWKKGRKVSAAAVENNLAEFVLKTEKSKELAEAAGVGGWVNPTTGKGLK